MGVFGSGFTVMLDRPLSVLEPVIVLKRAESSGRGIVTACEASSPLDNKGRSGSEGELPFHGACVSEVGGLPRSSRHASSHAGAFGPSSMGSGCL